MDKIHLDCHLYILIPLVQETNSIRSIVSIIALLKIKSNVKIFDLSRTYALYEIL